MKRMLFAGALSLFAATPAAFAADLPAGPPAQAPAAYVPVVTPVYNWSGIYIGINGGYGFGSTDWSSPTAGVVGTGTFNTNGGLVGGTAGFNFQSGQIVYGIEGDWDWAGIKGTSSNATATIGACPGAMPCSFETSSNWLSTVRGRVGYAFDRVLIYATGGGAAGDVKATFTNPNTPAVTGSTNSTEWGWTAGAGIEAALTENVTVKVEYLFVDLQNGNCSPTICGGGTAVPVSFDASIVRAGLNFKFNPW